jgi:hypothetical protein
MSGSDDNQLAGIATVRKKLRYLIAALIVLLSILLFHAGWTWCAHSLPTLPLTLELALLSLLVFVYVAGAVGGLCYFMEFLQHDLTIQGQWLVRRTRGGLASSVALDNVAELQVRRQGSFWAAGLDVGVGLVLRKPTYRGPFGLTVRGFPRLSRRLTGCHFLVPDVYEQPSEQIAAGIADAVKAVHQREVPVHVLTSRNPALAGLATPGVTVPDGVTCISCGYDLRGLQRAGACPECGSPIRESTRPDVDWHIDARWAARLQLGSALLFVAGLLALSFVAACYRVVVDAGLPPAPPGGYERAVLLGILSACLLIGAAGALTFTARSPAVYMTRDHPRSARFARYTLLLLLLALLGTVFWGPMWEPHLVCMVPLLLTLLALYARYVLTQLERPLLRAFALYVALWYVVPAAMFVVGVVVEWLSWFVPGIAQAASGRTSGTPPSDEEFRVMCTVLAVILALYPALFSSLFAATWCALRKLRIQQRSHHP